MIVSTMGYVLRMPRFDTSMGRGTVIEWSVAEGREITDGDPIAVVGSEKTTSEIKTREQGTLSRILVNNGETAEPGDPIGIVTGSDEDPTEYEAGLGRGAGRSAETRETHVESSAGYSGYYGTTGIEGTVSFDEPTEMGGSGRAPTPVEHLLGALGSCLSLSVRTMADRDDVSIGAIDCEVIGSPPAGPLESVAIELTIESDAAADALDRVLTKAERACYVERALAEDLEVSTAWQYE
jgi:pyruvate/2-oxoglutarate dehydrogenase complex dihydrolipoamide acyltransferase (E2) component